MVPKRKRLFLIRRDPRDISVVYFFDPELNCYFEIPYRDTSRPALTLWELREARTRSSNKALPTWTRI
jgi:putative transposase